MKCLQCAGAEIGSDARDIEEHARVVHNQSLAQWKQAHEQLSVSYPEDEPFASEVDEQVAEALGQKKPT